MEPLRKSISLDERKAKSTAWALTFADVLTLLLTFFVLLLVMLSDAEKTISVVIDKLLDKTYLQMTNDLSYDNISVDRETKGIKITIRGNLFKSTSAEIDSLYFPVVNQIGQIIKESELMNVQNNKDYSNFLKMIDKQGSDLNVEIRCEGHTDDEKLPLTAEYPSNWELSAARSLNIVRLMNQNAEMPEKYFSALSAKDQTNMLAAAAKAELRGWEMSAAPTVAQMAILKKNGMTVVNAPDSVITKMKEIGKEMMAGWRKDASPEAIAVLDRYLALQ